MVKLLVLGHISGPTEWALALTRVNELNSGKHGPFDVMLCTGADCAMPPSTSDSSTSPPPPQILYPAHKLLVRELAGLKILFLPHDTGATSAELAELTAIDVVVTNDAPKGFHRGSKVASADEVSKVTGTDKCAAVLAALGRDRAPRYHLTDGFSIFWQREPYCNGILGKSKTTRLVALAPVGSATKWIHALNIDITAERDFGKEAVGATVSPYGETDELSAGNAAGQFFFDVPPPSFGAGILPSLATGQGRNTSRHGKRGGEAMSSSRKQAKTKKPPARLDCWFCLASPSCENHLIAWLGEYVYVALPKGGVNETHVLIVPIAHETSLKAMEEEAALEEIANVLNKIEQVFALRGCSLLNVERVVKLTKAPQRHAYLECIPIPMDAIEKIDSVVLEQAKACQLEFSPLGGGWGASHLDNLRALRAQQHTAGGDVDEDEYLYVELPKGKSYICDAPKHHPTTTEDASAGGGATTAHPNSLHLPLAFGRMVYCHVTNSPKLVNWKDCVVSKDKESQWAASIKVALERCT